VPIPNPKPNEKDEKDVILYRWGGDTPNTFTPRPLADDNGLSLYTTPGRSNNQVTTRNTLLAQGWNVVKDPKNPSHYLLKPTDMSLYPGWQSTKEQYGNYGE
jgi:hypothetical protein